MNTSINSQSKTRKEAIQKLEGYLFNPGRFNVLVLGARGTGKRYWLNFLQQEHQKSDCLSSTVNVNASLVLDTTGEYWDMILEKANKAMLVINDVEKLPKPAQEWLFEALSTTNGKYGIKEKIFDCRIVFSSTYDIKTLRDSEEFLLHKIFDRISQLVVKFPSFSDASISIWKDFQNTWEKMKFKKESKIPGNELQLWLQKNAHQLHGNFRDLDKICINWHNLRLMGMNEKDILSSMTNDFLEFTHFPEHRTELSNTFHIKRGMTYDRMSNDFRKAIKDWAKIEFGSLKKASEELKVSHRTMERW